jgi:hypothetical protein
MELMTLMTFPISLPLSPSLVTVAVVFSAIRTASVPTEAAWLAFRATSLMLAFISSTPVATVCTLRLTCSADDETEFAWTEVSSALVESC